MTREIAPAPVVSVENDEVRLAWRSIRYDVGNCKCNQCNYQQTLASNSFFFLSCLQSDLSCFSTPQHLHPERSIQLEASLASHAIRQQYWHKRGHRKRSLTRLDHSYGR